MHSAKSSEIRQEALHMIVTRLVTHSLRDQRVMVTGASGFLGSHLCRRLHDEGAEIYAISRNAHEDPGERFHWLKVDLSEISVIRRMLVEIKPDVIFHFSGLASAVSDLEVVLPTLHTLLVSTVNLLTVAAEIGIARVVLLSSLQEPISDHVDPTPSSPYAAAKWASSAYGRMFSRIYRLPVVNLRVFQAYGPGQDVRKLIPYVTLALLRQQRPQLSSGIWEADWIYIDDVISGLAAAAQVRDVPERTIDLGSGCLTSVRDIVAHLVFLTGSRATPVFGDLPDRPLEPVRIANVTEAQSKLAWRPTVSIIDGLRRTVDAYRQTIDDELTAAPR